MATAAAGGYEGGAGGKFRKRPFRRAATPYDRPASALRNPIEARGGGWISKVVDPASRIITRSAQRLFSSFFRKTLPAPQAASETNHEPRNEFPEAVSINPSFGAQEPVNNEGDNPGNSSDNNGIYELEQMLKQKTFSRAEIDRLTELLRSRTVDIPVGDEKNRTEPSTSQPVADNYKGELVNTAVQENGMETQRLLGDISAPVISSSVLEENIASPAELAKAYMGNKATKVSPSTLGLRSHLVRKDLPLVNNLPLPQKSPSMLPAARSSVRFAGVSGDSGNGYLTPRSRGRSAIYSMARTPYSRIHPTATLKGVGSTSTSQWMWENNTLSGGKQVSKRRSSALDNDIVSVGRIRRIRQKTDLTSPISMGLSLTETPLSIPGTGVGSDIAQGSVSSIQKPLLLEEPKHGIPNGRVAENGVNSIRSASFASVPSQSSEVARKILQQLDKLVPSPKEKSSELNLAIARGKSPAKLMFSMLHEQAVRSVEDVDSKLVNNVWGTGELSGLVGARLPFGQDSTSQKQDKAVENGPMKIAGSGARLSSEANSAETTILEKDTVPSFKSANSAISNFVTNPPQKKQAFQMTTHKDSLELDDDNYSIRGAAPTLLADKKEKLDTAVEESKAIATETVNVEKPSVSEIRPPASFMVNKGIDTGASDRSIDADKNSGFVIPTTSAPSTIKQPAMLNQSAPLFTSVFSTKEQTGAPVFNFGSKGVDKAPPFTYSSTSSFSESLGQKFGVQSDIKPQTSSSPTSMAATVTESTLKAAESNNGDNNALKAGDLFTKNGSATLSGVSVSTTSSIFSFKTSTNNLVLNNGSVSPQSMTSCAESKNLDQKTNKLVAPFGSLTSSPFDATSTFTSTGNNIFGFSNSASASTTNSSSSANSQSQSFNPFSSGSGSGFGCQAAAGTRIAPCQSGSSAPSPIFGLSSSSTFSSGSSVFGSSSPASKLFSSSSGFGPSSSPAFSKGANSFSSASNTSLFGSCSQPATPIFGSEFSSTSSPVTGFSFGRSSAVVAATGSVPMAFGSGVAASSGSIFSFTSTASTASSASLVSASNPVITFGSASPGNDQMNKDSMAEDMVQGSTPVVPTFGQPSTSLPSGFMSSSAPLGAPFQFSGQQNPFASQNSPSPFEAAGNPEFTAGGSFSLGTGGGDKSNRRFIRVKRDKRKK